MVSPPFTPPSSSQPPFPSRAILFFSLMREQKQLRAKKISKMQQKNNTSEQDKANKQKEKSLREGKRNRPTGSHNQESHTDTK